MKITSTTLQPLAAFASLTSLTTFAASIPARSALAARTPLALLVLSLAALGACSTTEGFGEDVEKLGGNIEDSAARNK